MESEENTVSVWVGREEKLVLGLSKRTTCADVVGVLLEDRDSGRGLPAPRACCIVEKWRGFERILPNKTKILRLLIAWGDERRSVKLVLVKSEASPANHGARSAEARVVLSRQSPGAGGGAARAPAAGVSPEKQRRVVRKAFRKLEKINRRKTKAHRDASSAERMETLAHLVVSRDHTVRQQTERIAELDAEIETCEAKVHLDRIRRHGVNYVQDTYLADAAAAPGRAADALARLEEHVRRCDELLGLDDELREREALIDSVAAQIQEELSRRWMRRRAQELRRRDADAARGLEPLSEEEEEEEEEEERVKAQLDASLRVGLRLGADLEAVRSDLERSREICEAREKEMRELLEKVSTLEIEGDESRETRLPSASEGGSGWVEQARGLAKTRSVSDDDSDTGLSSLHSQDSDSHVVCESLV